MIRENWSLKFSAVFIICSLNESDDSPGDNIPSSISIISSLKPSSPATNQLKVLNREVIDSQKADNAMKQSKDIGVCVKPIHFNYSRTLDLIEFIELNRLLGVTSFTFYNTSISPQTNCVLEHYNRIGIVQVMNKI